MSRIRYSASMANTAAQLIVAARLRAGVSQAELARRSGVPRTVVNAYERGAREPGVDALERLANAAGLRVGLVASGPIGTERRAGILEQVLDLAEVLPGRRRGALRFPSMAALPGGRRWSA